MNRDLLDDRFGRFREIPMALARRGHEVQGLCLSYNARKEGVIIDSDERSAASVRWESSNLGRFVVPGISKFVGKARDAVRDFQPHVVWAGSDSIYGAMGILARGRSGVPIVFDIFDDFEEFELARVPGVVSLYRRTCRTADGVTSYSDPMTRHVVEDYRRRGPTMTVVSAADRSIFRPLDKTECRQRLGLPIESVLVGFAGSLSGRNGTSTVFEAVTGTSDAESSWHLVLAGHRDNDLEVPVHPNVHDLGVLEHTEVPFLLNALDVGIALARVGRAGDFSYPHRLNEMLACGLPVAAAAEGSMPEIMDVCPKSLFDPSDATDLSRAIRTQLDFPCSPSAVPDWDDVAIVLEGFLGDVMARG